MKKVLFIVLQTLTLSLFMVSCIFADDSTNGNTKTSNVTHKQTTESKNSQTVLHENDGVMYSFDKQTGVLTISGSGEVDLSYSEHFNKNDIKGVNIISGITSIGYFALEDCSNMAFVTIPNTVTSIRSNAFKDCSALTNISLPESLATIEWNAFIGCSKLTTIVIPNSVKDISSNAFSDCDNLMSIIVEQGNTIYDSRENCNAIIETATNTLVVGCKNTSIPYSVEHIGCYAFNYCKRLYSMIIPSSVSYIGENAFSNCSELTSVLLPNSLDSIGGYAFSGCSKLKSIVIPNSVKAIGSRTFSGCDNLMSIIVEQGNTIYDSRENCNAIIETATNTLVAGCKNTRIPNSVTCIGSYAFNDCKGLTSIKIPNSVTHIGESALYGCIDLMSIIVELGNTIYDSREDCNAIIETATNGLVAGCKNTIIPNSVTCIRSEAFHACEGLTSIRIPNSVTSIEYFAFLDCCSLISVYCQSTTPASCEWGSFGNVGSDPREISTEGISVFVPFGCVQKYKEAEYWKYMNIIELPEGFNINE